MRDTGGGTSANFVHTAAPQNKSAAPSGRKWDCADKCLDKLPTESRKSLQPADLSEVRRPRRDMWMDVNKRA
ncbi:hypothetical protein C7U92_10675 [Bradyrhizobium sp. WBOS7]|uniref:Uncharacterized protein n=1 Tax=Bradyrhizobium betae TaxID=244734 RepID=A0AAE9SRA9_9BRAD|nr:hypothetical protein [Bradyrhizobium sp. WBOS2]MDD1573146.1 hypothetical protein [Bradyrhizobium sp. WBOS1]MDD1577193.1 hypothetical protein [Bradyrhizobium sp. WBOS7]MDD1600240.1 hypothetical protein [Bradyrhizobium sp. WBOS16]UUO33928.1 hypothetical protein DCK84_04615 [Bradyrhizobium sp. WBOS01]UUO40460.1 hypothetical protein DCM75_06650 [Bradyrhizobium sp. WBOS02]UUO52626.1 hypothetical protein DCM79_06290 [Bradyrhizobium sp. WBOS07]UUO64753.1 hypothetical protein DCM83_05665 [Bradyrh